MTLDHLWIRFALAAFVVGTVADAVGCGEDKPCPPPILVCVSTQQEADQRNADLDPACGIYHVCDKEDGGADPDGADAATDALTE